jgi:hypothetical protein
VAIIAALVCLGTVPSVAWLLHSAFQGRPHEQGRDARYASQGGSRTATRQAQLRQRGDEDVDAAVETCGGLGVRQLAVRYGVEARREVVARRFSMAFEPGFRAHAFEGCLKGLSGGG